MTAPTERALEFARAWVDIVKLAADPQEYGARAFDALWQDLMNSSESKSKSLKAA